MIDIIALREASRIFNARQGETAQEDNDKFWPAVGLIRRQLPALLDRLEAAEAKLAQVREWLHTPEEDDSFDNGWYDAKEELRAILDAEPPTATVQPTAEGEQGEPNAD